VNVHRHISAKKNAPAVTAYFCERELRE